MPTILSSECINKKTIITWEKSRVNIIIERFPAALHNNTTVQKLIQNRKEINLKIRY